MGKARVAGIAVAAAAVAMAVAGYATSVADSGVGASATRVRPTVALRTTDLGKILVDGKGRTLYEFGKDRHGKSSCSDACAAVWPPLIVSGKARAGKGVDADKLTTVKRSDGTKQAVYNRHPLYRFAPDSKPGDTKGQGVNGFGARWYVLNAAGRLVKRTASQQAPMSNPYGY
jgi:predicted lipoprotein with Yx(FWY)xxD motif